MIIFCFVIVIKRKSIDLGGPWQETSCQASVLHQQQINIFPKESSTASAWEWMAWQASKRGEAEGREAGISPAVFSSGTSKGPDWSLYEETLLWDEIDSCCAFFLLPWVPSCSFALLQDSSSILQ